MKGGYYCPKCGALYRSLGSGLITCQRCGSIGLRGFERRPKRVLCDVEGCGYVGWDDGGVNDDLGRHMRFDHKEAS